jgi:hypothetical protein
MINCETSSTDEEDEELRQLKGPSQGHQVFDQQNAKYFGENHV